MNLEPEWTDVAPTEAQKSCRHNRRHRSKMKNCCLKCGARKDKNGSWLHLTQEWYEWYMRGGGPRPGDRRKAPRYLVKVD